MSARSRAPLRITHPINQNLLLSLKVLFFHAIGPSMPDISALCFTLSYLPMTNFCVAFTFSCVVERFLIERRKTKAKGITMANQNRRN